MPQDPNAKVAGLGVVAVLLVLLAVLLFSCFTVIQPGHRGVRVTMGKVSPEPLVEGLAWKWPLGISKVREVNIQQQTSAGVAECFSRDLQQLKLQFAVMYRTPSSMVVRLFQDYRGDPYDSLIEPRIQEALKQVTAGYEAEELVGNREKARDVVIVAIRKAVGEVVDVVDFNITNIDLTDELEKKIEEKMIAQQEAQRTVYTKQREQTQAEILLIQAKAEAEAAQIRGEAITKNPLVLQMQIIEKWNGISPTVVVLGQEGAQGNVILPITPTTPQGVPDAAPASRR